MDTSLEAKCSYAEPDREVHIFSICRLENIPTMVLGKVFDIHCNCSGYKRLLELLWDFLSPSLLIRL